MIHNDNTTQQFIEHIESIYNNSDYQLYMITTTFNMKNHTPDKIESHTIKDIRDSLKANSSNDIMSPLYQHLQNHRYKINKGLNHKIYESYITPTRLDFTWRTYSWFYSHLVQGLIKNPSRPSKLHLHPLTFDFIDVNGSKHHTHVFDDDGAVHLHSIYLVRNEIADKFDSLIEQDFMPILWHPKLTGIRAVHGTPIGSEPGDLSTVIEYASKYMTSHSARGMMADMELYFQYPLSSEERRQRRRDAQNLQADRSSR